MLLGTQNTKIISNTNGLCRTDISPKRVTEMYEEIRNEARRAAELLVAAAKLKKGDLCVVGCSSSEIVGQRIGKGSVFEVGQAVFEEIYGVLKKNGIYLGCQCCEHLNRAVVVEGEYAQSHGLEEVNVVPQPKAGGSWATAGYRAFEHPVVVEEVKADAGMDIGDTLIGMHLKRVAVPVRLDVRKIGEANVVYARTRPKFIGGCRAVYDEEKM